jgi:hypothetical protein
MGSRPLISATLLIFGVAKRRLSRMPSQTQWVATELFSPERPVSTRRASLYPNVLRRRTKSRVKKLDGPILDSVGPSEHRLL